MKLREAPPECHPEGQIRVPTQAISSKMVKTIQGWRIPRIQGKCMDLLYLKKIYLDDRIKCMQFDMHTYVNHKAVWHHIKSNKLLIPTSQISYGYRTRFAPVFHPNVPNLFSLESEEAEFLCKIMVHGGLPCKNLNRLESTSHGKVLRTSISSATTLLKEPFFSCRHIRSSCLRYYRWKDA